MFGWTRGSLAEYVCAPEKNLVPKPANLTFEQSSAVPTSATTALQALRDRGNVQAGQKVLIIGASGGVGTYAVQIARSFGADVTGVCSTRNLDMVRSIVAGHVIDYTQEDFSKAGQQYDVIVDTAGNRALTHLRCALKPEGTLVLVGGEGKGRVLGGAGRQIRAMALSPFVRQQIRPLLAIMRREDVVVLQGMLDAGTVKPVIDRTYPLSEIREAMRYQQAGHTQGKVVITV